MSADQHQSDDERRVAIRHAIMQQIQRGDVFDDETVVLAEGLGIRVPAYLRPEEGDAVESLASFALDALRVDTDLGPIPDVPEPFDPQTTTGIGWVEEFYAALAELWAAAGWMPFAFGQIGALLGRNGDGPISDADMEALNAMLEQVSGDAADLGEATKRVLVVAQHGVANARANALEQRAATPAT